MPYEWWISRWCEEFQCLPDAALSAWLHTPSGIFESILEFRAYAHAKARYEEVQHLEDSPAKRRIMADPLIALVRENDFAAVPPSEHERPITD